MKFSSSAVLAAVLFAPGAAAFTTSLPSVGPSTVRPTQQSGALFSTTEETEVTEEQERRRTKKDERLRMMKSDQFYRKGFKEVREDVESVMEQQFQSEVVDELKGNNYVIEREGVKVHLAKVRSLWSKSKSSDMVEICLGRGRNVGTSRAYLSSRHKQHVGKKRHNIFVPRNSDMHACGCFLTKIQYAVGGGGDKHIQAFSSCNPRAWFWVYVSFGHITSFHHLTLHALLSKI